MGERTTPTIEHLRTIIRYPAAAHTRARQANRNRHGLVIP